MLLYRPHFCCHCGEKIVRAKWTPLTSRRFCDFCAVEQKQHDLLPRVAAILLLILGGAGITSYFGGGEPGTNASNLPTVDRGEVKKTATTPANFSTAAKPSDVPSASNAGGAAANIKQLSAKANSSTEAVYYCGAITKKGTACTRRVKSPGRCWQHLGQPSASGARK